MASATLTEPGQPIPAPPWLLNNPELPGVLDWYERVRRAGHDVPTILRMLDAAFPRSGEVGGRTLAGDVRDALPAEFVGFAEACQMLDKSESWLYKMHRFMPEGILRRSGRGPHRYHRDSLVRWIADGMPKRLFTGRKAGRGAK